MASGANRVARGSLTGTGAAIDNHSVGFPPRSVKLFNVTGNCQAMWMDPMPSASMQKTVDSGAGTTDVSYVTSNGVTPLADGFTLGADTDLNVAAELVYWEAID